MAYTTINKSTEHFNTKLYTGNGGTQSITGVGFQPDFIWLKGRSATSDHKINDVLRGTSKYLSSNLTAAEDTTGSGIQSYDSDGFSLSDASNINDNSVTYASWNWLANGAGSANTDGSISSTVSANATSGFSIVSWTGSSADATIGHGLTQAPTIFIVKNRTDVGNWRVGQVLISSNNMTDGNGYYMELDNTKASTNPGSSNMWGSTPTAPTSSVFTVGNNNATNGSSDDMIAYCFHSVKGFSKFGSYVGNGNADGPFIYTGFKPAFVMTKNTSGANNWTMCDNKRNTFNPTDKVLNPNVSTVEATNNPQDFVSNGFKNRATESNTNASGSTYIYMAFAEAPLVGTNNVPANAR